MADVIRTRRMPLADLVQAGVSPGAGRAARGVRAGRHAPPRSRGARQGPRRRTAAARDRDFTHPPASRTEPRPARDAPTRALPHKRPPRRSYSRSARPLPPHLRARPRPARARLHPRRPGPIAVTFAPAVEEAPPASSKAAPPTPPPRTAPPHAAARTAPRRRRRTAPPTPTPPVAATARSQRRRRCRGSARRRRGVAPRSRSARRPSTARISTRCSASRPRRRRIRSRRRTSRSPRSGTPIGSRASSPRSSPLVARVFARLQRGVPDADRSGEGQGLCAAPQVGRAARRTTRRSWRASSTPRWSSRRPRSCSRRTTSPAPSSSPRRPSEADPDQPEYRTLLAWLRAMRRGDPPALREGQVSAHYDDLIRILDDILAKEKRVRARALLPRRAPQALRPDGEGASPTSASPRRSTRRTSTPSARCASTRCASAGPPAPRRRAASRREGGLFGKLFKR